MIQHWRQQARRLKQDTYALYFACQDPRLPWYVKLLAVTVVAYALSPIDLIPDFIPVLGYLDDLILVPFGIALVLKLIPAPILDQARQKAKVAIAAGEGKPKNWFAASMIICIWLFLAVLMILLLIRLIGRVKKPR